MAGITYKCPSCGAYLAFNPDTQEWACPFCTSSFTEGDLLAREQGDAEQSNPKSQRAQQTGEAAGEQVVYHCPSCGSEIVTDETTVATNCYYCHNPVVLQGKLTADMRPDCVLPFTISKDKAVERFMGWVKKKHFVPAGFFNQAQVGQMSGVYYPYFVAQCEVDGSFEGEGLNTSTATTDKYIITSTQHFHVLREGKLHFNNIIRAALKSTNRKLSDGIHPFPLDQAKPFSGAYLSGFLAERRDLDAASITEDLTQEVKGYVEPLLTEQLPYSSCHGNATAALRELHTQYLLLPTWVLTYPNKQKKEDPYYYIMNGCTGEVCGKLPIQRSKLNVVSLLVAAGTFVVACLLSYFLF
ncbi:MAG: TFIIB-type zinc ribbon-containing protein [Clostridia bacterium]